MNSLFQNAGIPVPASVPRGSQVPQHRDDPQERGHRVGPQSVALQAARGRGSRSPAGRRSSGMLYHSTVSKILLDYSLFGIIGNIIF